MKTILSLFLLFSLLVGWSNAAAFLSKWLLSSTGRRQTPGSLWQCPELPPDITYCSQPQLSFQSSVQEANVWIALLSSRCHPNLMKFVCTVHNPACLHSHQVMPILPCREFCAEVHSACVSRMSLFGFKWPEQVECRRFPSESESMCVTSRLESVTCAPCSQDVSRDNLVKKYCEADMVVKSQISGVTAFGNASSLLVKLNRISERLHPLHQPQPLPSSSHRGHSTGLQAANLHGFMDTSDDEVRLTVDKSRQLATRDPRQANVQMMAADDPTTTSPMSTTPILNTNRRKRKRRLGEKRRKQMTSQGGARIRRSPGGSFLQFTRPDDDELSKRMLLECAGCSLELPTSPMAPNSATRWLIMARKTRSLHLNSTTASPLNYKITAIIRWKKESEAFRNALHDIRTIPRAILCNPNTKVEIALGSFGGPQQPPRKPSTSPKAPIGANSPHVSWSRYGSPPSLVNRQPSPPWNLPPQFEGLFQNDASATGSKAMTKKERRQLRKQIRQKQIKKVQQQQQQQHQQRPSQQPRGVTGTDRLERRKMRRDMLAKMSPQERAAWKARRRQRREMRLQPRLMQPQNRNSTVYF